MKTKELNSLRKISIQELRGMALAKNKELEKAFKDLKKKRGLRRDIAQVLTIIREKEILEA